MEVANEIYSNGNRKNIERYTEHGQNINGSNNESNRYDGASPKTSKISTREQRQQRNNENGILTKTQSRNNRELNINMYLAFIFEKITRKKTSELGTSLDTTTGLRANNIPQSNKKIKSDISTNYTLRKTK